MAFARFVTMTGGELAIGNVLAVPRAELAAPVLGADLVALGPSHGGMIAADLSPMTTGPAREQEVAALGCALATARREAPWAPTTPGGTLPAWCTDFFSPFALYTRPRDDEVSAAVAGLHGLVRAFVEATHDAPAGAGLRAARIVRWQEYAAAHRTDDKGLQLLAKVFGRAWAERFVAEVLFPSELPVS